MVRRFRIDVGVAVDAVADVDAVLLVPGTFARWSDNGWDGEEGEGTDRHDLLLPINQSGLVAAVAAAAAARGIPVAVTVMSGGPVDLRAAKASGTVQSIIWAGFPGQHGGAAVADAVFGTVGASGQPQPSKFGKLSQVRAKGPLCAAANKL